MATFGLIGLLIVLTIPAGIIYGIVTLVRRSGGSQRTSTPRSESLPGAADRIFSYVLSFAGLMAVLFGLSTLIALAFIPVIPGASDLIGADDIRTRVSYSLAALIVGAPAWLLLWRRMQQRIMREPVERDAIERHLYLGAIFATAGIVALFGAREALTALIAMLGAGTDAGHIRDAVSGATLFAVYGAAWLVYARLGRHERPPRTVDWPHDLALYILTGVSFFLLLFGLGDFIRRLIEDAQGAGALLYGSSSASEWSDPLASVLIGGAAWAAAQLHDFRRGSARILRAIYLYLIILFVAPLTIFNASSLLYELVRRAFGYSSGTSSFLADTVPWLIVGGMAWAYHWMVMRDQARLQPISAQPAAIPYPRRPAYAIYTIAGTIMAAAGAAIAMWIGVDSVLSTPDIVSGGAWWRDNLSSAITLLVVGCALWLPAWTLMQQAAARDPETEGAATARKAVLFILSLGGALVALGFAIALLYQILRAILGETDAHTFSDTLHFASTMLVALAVAAYYGPLLRTAIRRHALVSSPDRVHLTVLLAPGADAALGDLMHAGRYDITILGYLHAEELSSAESIQNLQTALSQLGAPGQPDKALLMLGLNGGQLYPYDGAGAPVTESPPPAVDTQPTASMSPA